MNILIYMNWRNLEKFITLMSIVFERINSVRAKFYFKVRKDHRKKILERRAYKSLYTMRAYLNIHAQFHCSVFDLKSQLRHSSWRECHTHAQSLAMSSKGTFEAIINSSRYIIYSLVIMNIQVYNIVHIVSFTCMIIWIRSFNEW